MHPLQNPKVRAKYYEEFLQKSIIIESKFKKILKKYFNDQLQRLRENLGEPSSKRKNLVDDIFYFENENKIGLDILFPFLLEILRESGQDTVEFAGLSTFKLTSTIEATLRERAEFFINKMNETTFEKLQTIFIDNLNNAGGGKDLIRKIENLYENTITKSRAGTIARTELQVAIQQGKFAGYKQSGISIKIWVHTYSQQPRNWHEEMDGEEVSIDSVFSNGLRFPGDPQGPAEEIINCNCTI